MVPRILSSAITRKIRGFVLIYRKFSVGLALGILFTTVIEFTCATHYDASSQSQYVHSSIQPSNVPISTRPENFYPVSTPATPAPEYMDYYTTGKPKQFSANIQTKPLSHSDWYHNQNHGYNYYGSPNNRNYYQYHSHPSYPVPSTSQVQQIQRRQENNNSEESEEGDTIDRLWALLGPLFFPIPFFLAAVPFAIPAIPLALMRNLNDSLSES